jgi:hypothetical protein
VPELVFLASRLVTQLVPPQEPQQELPLEQAPRPEQRRGQMHSPLDRHHHHHHHQQQQQGWTLQETQALLRALAPALVPVLVPVLVLESAQGFPLWVLQLQLLLALLLMMMPAHPARRPSPYHHLLASSLVPRGREQAPEPGLELVWVLGLALGQV